jgi:predicted O-methyltransferase YrrM
MNGTLATKFCRLAGDLATHPSYAARYVSDNVLHSRTPLELEIPWFSYAAVDFLEKTLQPQMTVCEYGSGGSTLFFARHVRTVHSIEDNPRWFELVNQRIKELGIGNAKICLHPFDFKNPVGFEKSAYLNAVPEQPCDVYVIDGSEEWEQVRPICFRHVERLIRPGGMIIVDDSWRYPELRRANKAKRMQTFQSVGASRPGVTSTDVFFY